MRDPNDITYVLFTRPFTLLICCSAGHDRRRQRWSFRAYAHFSAAFTVLMDKNSGWPRGRRGRATPAITVEFVPTHLSGLVPDCTLTRSPR